MSDYREEWVEIESVVGWDKVALRLDYEYGCVTADGAREYFWWVSAWERK